MRWPNQALPVSGRVLPVIVPIILLDASAITTHGIPTGAPRMIAGSRVWLPVAMVIVSVVVI